MNRNTRSKLKLLRKTDPGYFKTRPRKSHRPKVAGKGAKEKLTTEEENSLYSS